jgi:TonB family protein
MGKAKVAFDILEDGTVDNVRIVKSAHPLLDEELVRVVKLSPAWKPATRHDKPVRTTYTLPFIFELR